MQMLGALFLQQGMPERALALYAALDAEEPARPEHLRGVVLSLSRMGRHEQALQALDRLALAGGVDARFHLIRAQTLAHLDRTDEAASSMRAYVDSQASPETGALQGGSP
jgi:tetratricopeptide (TPR) repeat protein